MGADRRCAAAENAGRRHRALNASGEPMKTSLIATAIAFAALAPAFAAPPPVPEAKLVLIIVQSRIDIGADGQVTAIHSTPELPADIAAIVEGNLRKLRYAAPTKEGKPVPGVTYALQGACAAPVDGRYSFAVKYMGNGP